MHYLTVHTETPTQYFLVIENRNQEISINCTNVENFTTNQDGTLTLIYHIPMKDVFGRTKNEMERRIEEYDCAESQQLLKTYQGIR